MRLLLPLRWLGRILHGLRRLALDLLTLAVIAFVVSAGVVFLQRPGIPAGAVLWVAPEGRLVYSYSEPRWSREFGRALGRPSSEVRIRDLTTAIDRAAKDPRIRALALDLRRFGGGSLPAAHTVARAVARFRAAGKPVYAYATSYSQSAYLVAAPAGHIFLDPMGAVLITGYADERLYFGKLLTRLGVRVYTFRKGKYKSAVEPLMRNGMSAAAREENEAWLHTWWSTYVEAVSRARGLAAAQVAQYADRLPQLLTGAGGDTAALALERHLVTRVADYAAFRAALTRAVLGRPSGHLPKIGYKRYLAAAQHVAGTGAVIAVVPIDGALFTGAQALPGTVAAGATVRQIDRLRRRSAVRAVVLQVNSPGGSVYAANEIRRALLRLRRTGKPVVVSMGTLGASGAYWLSTAAQRIYAHRTTITADIGVFAVYPDLSGALDRLGIGVSSVATTPTAGALSPFRPLRPAVAVALQASVDHIYRRFVDLVAAARRLTPARAQQIAQGRAWSGAAALRLGLIDGIGGLRDAVRSAAQLAKLKTGRYRVDYLPPAGQSGWARGLIPQVARTLLGRDAAGGPLTVLRALAPRVAATRGLENLLLLVRAHPGSPLAYSFILPP